MTTNRIAAIREALEMYANATGPTGNMPAFLALAHLDALEKERAEPAAYWARFSDGSGRIFETKQHAENYAARAYTNRIEVIPVYKHSTTIAGCKQEGYEQ